MRSKYTIYKRPGKKKNIYYVQFTNPDGSPGIQKSTGKTNRAEAREWADNYLSDYIVGAGSRNTLGEFAKDFFSINSEWAKDKRSRGLIVNDRQCLEKTLILNNHIISLLGSYPLPQIDRQVIKEFRIDLSEKRKLAGNTINKIQSCLRVILESAVDNRLIKEVPRIDRVGENAKEKGIITTDEALLLFRTPEIWGDFRGYTASLLSACTGMRHGEIQGLLFDSIDLETGVIIVRRSWDKKLSILNQTTKNRQIRTVIVTPKTLDAIHRLNNMNPYKIKKDSFVFYGGKPEKPLDRFVTTTALEKALASIGLSKEIQRQRNITFHSWRHYANSGLLNAGIDLLKVEALIGHSDKKMSKHYYHPDTNFDDILNAQKQLIGG